MKNFFSSHIKRNKEVKSECDDQDILVDYQPNGTIRNRKRRQIRFLSNNHSNNDSFIYKLEYDTETGFIKSPSCYYDESIGETNYDISITSNVIRSVILKQHCRIKDEDELEWFEDGLKWLAEQHCMNEMNTLEDKVYRYSIKEADMEKCIIANNEKDMLEDFERACEAYFGVPLRLCEDHWASKYMLKQASKGKWLHRIALKVKKASLRTRIRRLFCLGCY
ncbi:MAG: hypothetical protein EXX96DRAFT_555164 [Benjaminiella poitrasii]|nr:MAG: hypothetical protein EXX96DRAFT_555164 [Benjaminiella poitrasii]